MIVDHNDLALEMKLQVCLSGVLGKEVAQRWTIKKDLALFKYSQTINGFVLTKVAHRKLLY